MNFRFIDQLNLGITIDLQILKRDSQRYSTLLYQHEGNFFADQNRIGNADDATAKFQAFFAKAKETHADLAITPEYSCPWKNITDIISNPGNWPDHNKLWAIGCESISLAEMTAFKAAYNQGNVVIFSEALPNNTTKRFFDPLVYIFQALRENDPVLTVLIQFKTCHMGVWGGGDIERNNLIEGQNVYILKNSSGLSINLMTMICSEAMNFSDELTQEKAQAIRWEDDPFLILNPQLNPKPTYIDFIIFRKRVFRSPHKEIISLNWHMNMKYQDHLMITDSCSRSGFYINSNEIELQSRDRIVSNHKKGLYYFNGKNDRHNYLLSSTSHCFLIENLPVKITNAQAVQIRRDGPEVLQTYKLNDQNILENITPVNDEHHSYITSTGCQNQYLLNPSNCVLDKERLVCLSTGMVDGKAEVNWYQIPHINSLIMDESEVNGRITVARNTGPASQGVKTKFITAISELTAILNSKVNLPDSLPDIKRENAAIGYYTGANTDKYRFNLINDQGEKINATIAYVGYSPYDVVEETYTNLRRMFDNGNKDKERVVVFYKRDNLVLSKFDNTATNVIPTDDTDYTSIVKEETYE